MDVIGSGMMFCENNNDLMNLFGIFSVFLLAYGFRLNIWEKSQTIKYVIVFAFIMSITAPHLIPEAVLLISVMFLLGLFVVAILRKRDIA